MLKPAPPIPNVERQRQFRLRNPGYEARRKARQRAACKASAEAFMATQRALFAAERAANAEPRALPDPAVELVLPDSNAA